MAAVLLWPRALHEVRHVRGIRPMVTVDRDLTARIQVVQYHELACELVMVRRDRLAEQRQPRIAVAVRLAVLGEIAEQLVVRAILLDDVQHVLDRRRVAESARHRIRPGPGRLEGTLHHLRLVLRHVEHGLRHRVEMFGVGHVDVEQDAVQLRHDVWISLPRHRIDLRRLVVRARAEALARRNE